LIAVNSDDNHRRQKGAAVTPAVAARGRDSAGRLRRADAAGADPTPHSAGIRLVCVDRIPDRLPVDSVSVEDVSAAELAIDHLIAMGHQRIAIVTGPLTLKNERQRLLGYHQSRERAGFRADSDLIWEGNILPDDVARIVLRPSPRQLPQPSAPAGRDLCHKRTHGIGRSAGIARVRPAYSPGHGAGHRR